MARLCVRVLGGLTVVAGGGRVLPIAASCRPVLGYLLTHRQRQVSRAELAETLWAERKGEQARRCLSTALWRLKRSTAATAPLVAFHGVEKVSFNWAAPAWVDSVALELRLAPLLRRKPETLRRDELARLERGARLYRGDYLVGMDQEWAWLERQRLRTLFYDSLYQLMMAHAAVSEWSHVLKWGQRLSREEPLREDVHRLLMLAYLHTGNRAAAIAQYQTCERALSADLGIAPMAETRELFRTLLRDPRPRAAADPPAIAPALENVRRRVGRVRRALAASQQQLDKALDALGAEPPKSIR